jgi:hypothetical protein
VTNSAAESDDSFPEANGATTTKPYVSTTARLEPPQGVTASKRSSTAHAAVASRKAIVSSHGTRSLYLHPADTETAHICTGTCAPGVAGEKVQADLGRA